MGDDTQDPVRSRLTEVDFPALMAKVQQTVAAHAHEASPTSAHDEFVRVQRIVEETLAKIGTPTARTSQLADRLRQQVHSLLGMLEGRMGPPADTPKHLHPTVYLLLLLNYHFAKGRADVDSVNAEFRRVVATLTKGAKGRPRTITEDQLRQAQELHEAGNSFAQIGKTLGLGAGRRVRTALKHHYPDKHAG